MVLKHTEIHINTYVQLNHGCLFFSSEQKPKQSVDSMLNDTLCAT